MGLKNCFFLGLIMVFCMTSCSQGDKALGDIEELMEDYEFSPNDDQLPQLEEKINSYVLNHPNDHENAAKLLRRMAEIHLQAGKTNAAVADLKKAIMEHLEATSTPENVIYLAEIYTDKVKKPTQTSILYQGFVKQFPNHSKTSEIQSKVKDLPPAAERISEFGERIFDDSTQQFNPKMAVDFIDATENFALLHRQDSSSAIFLIDAAIIARNFGNFPKVLELYRWVYTYFPENSKAADARFLEAFTYDADLKNYEKAEEGYKNFLKDYPNHAFTDDAEISLDNLGKSDEEILKELEAKASGNQ